MGRRFLLTQESGVPDQVKQRYLAAGLNDTYVSTAFDGQPTRVLQSEESMRIEEMSRTRRLLHAPRNAALVRRQTGQSRSQVVREGLSMRKNQGMTLSQMPRAADAPMMVKAAMVGADPVNGLLPTGAVWLD